MGNWGGPLIALRDAIVFLALAGLTLSLSGACWLAGWRSGRSGSPWCMMGAPGWRWHVPGWQLPCSGVSRRIGSER